jgi:hypothetical protein
MTKQLKTTDYMVDGWDRSPHLAVHPYKRGSKHNKVGMWIMWTYYVLITLIVIRLIYVLNT